MGNNGETSSIHSVIRYQTPGFASQPPDRARAHTSIGAALRRILTTSTARRAPRTTTRRDLQAVNRVLLFALRQSTGADAVTWLHISRIFLTIDIILVDRPCAMGIGRTWSWGSAVCAAAAASRRRRAWYRDWNWGFRFHDGPEFRIVGSDSTRVQSLGLFTRVQSIG